MQPSLINKFEFHYFFSDDSHTMDAFVRNNCESEALLLVKEIIQAFDVNLLIETEPYLEGGLKQIWKFLGKNQLQINIVLTALNLILTNLPKGNSRLDQLQEEKLKLEIEEKRINLQRLKMNAKEQIDTNYKNYINDSIQVFETNLKIIKHRSNFFYLLNTYPKVSEISTSVLRDDYKEVEKPRYVKKEDFTKFILETNDLPRNVDESALISIISPVLRKGKYKWKGIYQGLPIEFYMKDENFKDAILKQEVSFKNGISIKCVLEVNKKLNELGYEQITNHNVLTVLAVNEGGAMNETEQGKHHRRVKEAERLQTKLEF